MGAYAAKSTGIGAPVTLNQVEQLVDYIAKNNPDYQNGKAVNTDQTDWSAVEEYARTIMMPDQFDIFTNHNADHVIWQKLNRALDAIIIDAARQNAGTPPSQ